VGTINSSRKNGRYLEKRDYLAEKENTSQKKIIILRGKRESFAEKVLISRKKIRFREKMADLAEK
jgi:hypothetical protein